MTVYDRDLFGYEVRPTTGGLLAARFGVAPFSVLNAAEGAWLERKRLWCGIGIQSELGRDAAAYNTGGSMPDSAVDSSNTSIFDPALTETLYEWFSAPGDQVVDPFAGGSVRGVVAGVMGRNYYGVDLSAAQIQANEDQAHLVGDGVRPTWVHGDCITTLRSGAAPRADMIMTCPPYGDLEVYSDDPRDLSTMDYHGFMGAMGRTLLATCKLLRDDRFAVWVVGDYRNPKTGYQRGFVADTISAARTVGFGLLNHLILVTPRGTLPQRAAKQFTTTRKIGKTHQDVLVFVKGDPRAATARIEGRS